MPVPAPAEIDPAADYDVTLAEVARLPGLRFRPRDAHVMRGDLLIRLIEENGAHVVAAAERR